MREVKDGIIDDRGGRSNWLRQ